MPTWILATDFSDLAVHARATALEQLAALGGGRLVVVHVHMPGTSVEGGVDLGVLGHTAIIDRACLDDAEQRVARERAECVGPADAPRYPSITVETRVELGMPPERIAELATEEHADQIVVGSHGRRGFERFLLGSVAERIVRLAPCSVLVVKS